MFEVFLCSSPTHFPLSLACHTWFVIHEGWKLLRYEILFYKNKDKKMWYLHIKSSWVFDGLRIIPCKGLWKWRWKVISKFSGKSTEKIIAVIKNSQENYSHLHKYQITGPNSNTYTQWLLNQFPEWKVTLPWNAFWKNY